MDEARLDGGNVGGAVRVGDTVRRTTGPWTPAVHALLTHLAAQGFAAAPRPLGIDERGREILTFLDGETVGSVKPWPSWVHADGTLDQVARWMRRFHDAYGWDGSAADLLDVVRERVTAHADGIRALAAAGEAAFVRLRDQGVLVDLERALAELDALCV